MSADAINTILHQTDLETLLNFSTTCTEFHQLVSTVFNRHREESKTLLSLNKNYRTAGVCVASLKTEFIADMLFQPECFRTIAEAVSKKIAHHALELAVSNSPEVEKITLIIHDEKLFALLEKYGFTLHYADALISRYQETKDVKLYISAIRFAIKAWAEKHHLECLKKLFDRVYEATR